MRSPAPGVMCDMTTIFMILTSDVLMGYFWCLASRPLFYRLALRYNFLIDSP